MKLYNIDLDTTNTDPLNQLRIEAEVKYALLEDLKYIIDSESRVFAISEDDSVITLTELPEDEDEESSETEDECECSSVDYDEVERMTNSELIDTILRKSLLSTAPITLEQAQTMLVLANLQALLEAE